MSAPLRLVFAPETKGTWKFEEVLDSQFAEPKVGTLYVRKGALGELGFQIEERLVVTICRESES